MREKDITTLVRRYEEMLAEGRNIYFDAEEFDELAEYYNSLDDLSQAETIVTKGLSIHPDNQQLMLKKAKLMILNGFYEKALGFLNENFNGYDLDLYLLKIECLLCLDLRKVASELINVAIEKEKSDPGILYSELGFLYSDIDCYNEAIGYFEKSLQYDPENEDVLIELSYSYEMKSDFESAVQISNKLLDINPYAYDVWINLGKLYSLQEEFENAIDAFDFACTINEFDRDALKLKAHCLSLVGRIDESIKVFKELEAEYPTDESIYNSLSECYFSLGLYDEMFHYLSKYEEIRGETIETIAKKAVVHIQNNNNEQAAALIDRGLQIDPNNEDINIVAGEYYFETDNYPLAETFFHKVYSSGNRHNSTLLDRLSLISIAKNEIEEAINYMEKLIELVDDTQTKVRLGLLYFESGEKKKFISYIETFMDDELRYLASIFFSDETFDLENMSRQTLINRLNDARECRILFKNIKY